MKMQSINELGKRKRVQGSTSTQKAIEFALNQNRELQDLIREKILALAQRKAQNRKRSQELMGCLYSSWSMEDFTNSPPFVPLPASFYNAFGKKVRKRKIEENVQNGKCQQAGVSLTTKNIMKKWRYPIDGKWKAHYFVDPFDSMPEPNCDAKRSAHIMKSVPNMDDYKWKDFEIESVIKAVDKISRPLTDDDWKEIQKSVPTKSEDQLKLKYVNDFSPSINKDEFSKDESLKIIQLVYESNGDPKWDEIATNLNSNRTTWQCFKHYQSCLDREKKNDVLTSNEAELLLKTIASKGPTYVLNKASISEIASQSFPNRTHRQLHLNAQASIGNNPLLSCGEWSEEEEMTLCLAMKIYQNSSRPIMLVQNHIPNRAAKQISVKWNNSLRPSIQLTSFTNEEDNRLLKVVSEVGSTGNWKEVLKEFPNREMRQLKQRYDQLLDTKSFVKRVEDSFKYRQLPTANHFSVDDFVIRSKYKNDDDIYDSEYEEE